MTQPLEPSQPDGGPEEEHGADPEKPPDAETESHHESLLSRLYRLRGLKTDN